MNIVFLQPVFDALLNRGKPRADLAAQINLPPEALDDPSVTLPANSAYAFLRWATLWTEDPMFLTRVGKTMAQGGWVPLLPLMASAQTVGDFFQKFSLLSSEQGKSASYKLVVEGPIALWLLTRPAAASNDAEYADAVAAGFFIQLLKLAARDSWNPNECIAVLPNPSLVPIDLLPTTSVIRGQLGLSLRFPSACLGLPMPQVSTANSPVHVEIPTHKEIPVSERVKQVIELRISEPSLGVEAVATALGMKKWKLQSFLSKEETSVSAIREEFRRGCAIERIVGTRESVTTIARDLGYTDSSNFTRAFRLWTGKSPREMRRDI